VPKHRPPLCRVDSVDPFALYAGEEAALKFFRTITARVKEKKATGTATFTSGIHSTRFQSSLRTDFEGVIELNLDESKGKLERSLRILSIKGVEHDTDWYPFKITNEGILIGSEDYRRGLPVTHKDLHSMRFANTLPK